MENKPHINWPDPGKIVTCPGCKKENHLLTYDLAITYTCSYCKQLVMVGSNELKKISTKTSETNYCWEIGKTGYLNGDLYQITGIVLRKEKGANYTWYEYFLFNPIKGFRYLSEYEGHWIYFEDTIPYSLSYINTFTIEDENEEDFHLFLRYKTSIEYCAGEFPFEISDINLKLIKEFINPPFMYLKKDYANQVNWLKGEHISFKKLVNAFGEPLHKPEKTGVGSLQPQILGIDTKSMLRLSSLAVLIMVFFYSFFSINKIPETVFSDNYSFSSTDSSSRLITTPSFTMGNGTDNIEYRITHDLNQNWLELEINLVNDETGDEYLVTQELSFYSGTDDEGHWTEGSKTESPLLSAIPEGKYHLTLMPYQSNKPDQVNLSFKVIRGVDMFSNLLWICLFLIIAVFIQYMRNNEFEVKRWKNSNYNPHNLTSVFDELFTE